MEKPATHHMYVAYLVLKTNISYIFIPALLTSSIYLSHFVTVNFKFIYFLAIGVTLFVLLPLYYGQFFEIINTGQKDTWSNVLKKYWMRIFLVSLILRAPTILLSLIGSEMVMMKEIFGFIIEIVSIYILPVALFEKETISSIKLGVKCLVGNLKYSFPLVFILIFSFFLPFLQSIVLKYIHIQVLSYAFAIAIIFLLIFIEFTIFIAASLILREKLFTSFH